MSRQQSKSAEGSHPSGPFVIDIRSLGRRAGSMQQVHRTVQAEHKIGAEMLAIAPRSPIDLDLRLEAVSEGVLVTGTVSGDIVGQCARCLEPIQDTVNVFMTELFAYPGSETEATTDEEEVYRIVDDVIDLEQAVNDVVGLELPLVPLCSPDCPGLCPDCGVRLAVAEAGHSHDKIDPRWAKLADKFPDRADRPASGLPGGESE